jgi:hypothetical protein
VGTKHWSGALAVSLLGGCSLYVLSSGKDDHLVRWVCKRSAMHFRVFVICRLEVGQIGGLYYCALLGV